MEDGSHRQEHVGFLHPLVCFQLDQDLDSLSSEDPGVPDSETLRSRETENACIPPPPRASHWVRDSKDPGGEAMRTRRSSWLIEAGFKEGGKPHNLGVRCSEGVEAPLSSLSRIGECGMSE